MANTEQEFDLEDFAVSDQEIDETEQFDDDIDLSEDKDLKRMKEIGGWDMGDRKPTKIVDISGKEHGPNAKVHVWHNAGPGGHGNHTYAETRGSSQENQNIVYHNRPTVSSNQIRKHWMATGPHKVDEETLAASSLHPKARPGDPMSKLGAMHGVMNVMAGMGKSDLINFFNQVQSQFGPGKDHGVGDKSASNQSTLDMKASHAVGKSAPKTKDAMPKLNVKEDIEEMFNGQDLSEEFKDNVATIFEAAVSARLIAETVRLEEEFETRISEEIAIFNEEVTSKLDTYLDYVVENWMKENEVAIESTLRNELASEFVEGLKNLFAEHYINVPEDKVDVLEAMAEKVSVLEAKLDETISENVELKNFVVENKANEIFEELASDLALTQQEKFAALAEGIEFDGDLDIYAKKLMIVKENYFRNENPSYSSNIEEETFEGEINENVKNVDPVVNRYVQAIAKTVKK